MTARTEANSLSSLLEAEERANRIIREAEELRDQARAEAQERAKEEIAQLRKTMEAEYQREKQAGADSGESMEEKSNAKIQQHTEEFEANKHQVIDMLVKRIMHVKYELPRNVKADFASLLRQDGGH